MSLFGTLPTFNHQSNDWTIFLSQLENFFVANDIDDSKLEKKKAILITSLSEESIKLLKGLIHPVEVIDANYNDLRTSLNDHFRPARSTFTERLKFYSAYKSNTETIPQWAARLRSLSRNCEFGSDLTIALRDKFVIGLSKGPIKDKLFMEDTKKLTFDKAIEIAHNLESTFPSSSESDSWKNNKFQDKESSAYQNKHQEPAEANKYKNWKTEDPRKGNYVRQKQDNKSGQNHQQYPGAQQKRNAPQTQGNQNLQSTQQKHTNRQFQHAQQLSNAQKTQGGQQLQFYPMQQRRVHQHLQRIQENQGASEWELIQNSRNAKRAQEQNDCTVM